jgi:hypothetical protein
MANFTKGANRVGGRAKVSKKAAKKASKGAMIIATQTVEPAAKKKLPTQKKKAAPKMSQKEVLDNTFNLTVDIIEEGLGKRLLPTQILEVSRMFGVITKTP